VIEHLRQLKTTLVSPPPRLSRSFPISCRSLSASGYLSLHSVRLQPTMDISDAVNGMYFGEWFATHSFDHDRTDRYLYRFCRLRCVCSVFLITSVTLRHALSSFLGITIVQGWTYLQENHDQWLLRSLVSF
jgi:hypothetical protein